MAGPTRWTTETAPGHSQRYINRFRQLAVEGADLAGEARLVDALIVPGSLVLDAGCGTGRVGAALAARGHDVVGVDADEALIRAAREDHPTGRWLVADLTELDLPEVFDAAVLAGNVMVYVAAGTEVAVLGRLAAHVRMDGPIVVGFATDRHYRLADFDAHVAAAGLRVEHRFATWDLRPWRPGADYAVTILRGPAAG